ncbi:MAG TPA: hypothetical protein VGL78_18695 [Solirubrobacteraceae bacterium]|jgi:hypothetical protein
MIGTLLDSSAGSRARLVREIANLLRVGMYMRAAQTRRTSPQRLLADGFCRGAILLMILDLSTLLSQRLDGVKDPLLSWTSIGVLGAILALALVGAERLAGTAALTWAAARFPELVAHNHTFNGLAPTVVPLICFTVLIVNPRRRRLDLRRVAWLLVPAVLVAAYAPRGANGPITVLVSLAAILFALVALLKIPTDPRLAIACALPATYVALMVAGTPAVPAVLLCVGAPLVMGVATIRLWRLPEGGAIR